MRNGSKPEYFHVEGALKLTRMRQSEWRRRGGGLSPLQVFDGQVGAGVDDGHSRVGTYTNAVTTLPFGGSTDAGNPNNAWARFTNVTIPGGATVFSAYLTVEAQDSSIDGAGVKTNIHASDEDNAAAPATEAEHAADPRTAASTAWDDVDFVVNTPTDSPDISAAIQEVLDRGGWSSGNALMMLLEDDGSDTDKWYQFHSYDGNTAKAVKLHVEYQT